MIAATCRTTLKDIARIAGVSRMTVSLALRNAPSLPETTRSRIKSIAERLGYQPDPDLIRFMEVIRAKKQKGAPSKIAYLTAYDNRSDWRKESTQWLYFDGAHARARECGYVLEEYWLREPGMTDRRLSEIIRNRGIDGIIVAPLPGHEPIFDGFCWDYASSVELGYSLSRPALNRACNHQFQSMMLLYLTLSDFGYSKIALAMPRNQDERVNHHWRAAFLTGQSLRARSARKLAPFLPEKWSRSAFEIWFRKNRPDCVITIGKDIAGWLLRMGLKTPQDIGLANVDLSPDMHGITGIDQNSRKVGAAAVDLLISQMRHNERGIPAVPRIVMVEGGFVRGTTTLNRRQESKSLT
ncbi:MAG: LacI family DNA-binding transcriptional regulator [Opitutaceae bacterium]|nr:LacI family DNA-binding transcriptional regulator [Opitutaceae bacterium]